MRKIFTILIRVYQYAVSPFIGPCCRFHPTCSNYAIEAIHAHGAWKGSYLTLRRILRCNPWHSGGVDPVPEHCGWHH